MTHGNHLPSRGYIWVPDSNYSRGRQAVRPPCPLKPELKVSAPSFKTVWLKCVQKLLKQFDSLCLFESNKKNLGLYFLCLNLFYFSFPFPIDLFVVYFVNVPGLNGKKQTIKINWYTGICRKSALSYAASCFFPVLMQSAPPRVSNEEWSGDPAALSVPPQPIHPTSGDLETQQGGSPELPLTSSNPPHFQSHSPLGQEKMYH